ncbi:MAG: SDR family oxidoreductase [Gammaproteobacteria bacterium]|nr:SDR family oxidoreductase [Gammaproteobacteria bacterium]
MKIIVTGATGHIGSYLIRDLGLQFKKSEIVMIDNMMTQRFASLFNLPKTGNYSFVEGDVRLMDLNSLFKGADIVIHLAAITDAAGSFDKATEVEENNYQSTFKVANACLEAGSSLIALSSTSVYGTQNDVVDEDCSENELQPQSPYASIKLKEEELISNLSKDKGLRTIHCRFGTIFGASPGMRFHTAVNKFCWQATMGQPITVWNTAYDQKRPYLDLLDASRAIIHIIENNIFDGQIYNVLTQNSTVRQVVDTIREFVPSLEVEFVDTKIMNQLSYEVLCDRFKSHGFVFSGDIKRGIEETILLLKNSNKY